MAPLPPHPPTSILKQSAFFAYDPDVNRRSVGRLRRRRHESAKKIQAALRGKLSRKRSAKKKSKVRRQSHKGMVSLKR